jgi:hypothetical protein
LSGGSGPPGAAGGERRGAASKRQAAFAGIARGAYASTACVPCGGGGVERVHGLCESDPQIQAKFMVPKRGH